MLATSSGARLKRQQSIPAVEQTVSLWNWGKKSKWVCFQRADVQEFVCLSSPCLCPFLPLNPCKSVIVSNMGLFWGSSREFADMRFSLNVLAFGEDPQVAQGWRTHLPMQDTQEMQVRSLGWEDPLGEQMATHSSVLAWKIPRTEEPGGLQSTGSQKSQTCLSKDQHLDLCSK